MTATDEVVDLMQILADESNGQPYHDESDDDTVFAGLRNSITRLEEALSQPIPPCRLAELEEKHGLELAHARSEALKEVRTQLLSMTEPDLVQKLLGPLWREPS